MSSKLEDLLTRAQELHDRMASLTQNLKNITAEGTAAGGGRRAHA